MQLKGYTNLTKFAEGGMATLYKGYQESLNRPIVVKVLSIQSFWDKTSKKLFDQESLVIAKLNHPNIVHIIDRGLSAKGRPYFVMEYIKGMNLADYMEQTKSTVKVKTNILMQAAKALSFAHKNGVIHRDIKPANILISSEGHVKLLDFGIAWLTKAKNDPNSKILGTPDYMSPEQFSSPFDVTHLSDIYSLGVLMYELYMQKLPTEHLENIAQNMALVPQPVVQLVEQCLELRPELRPQSMDEVKVRLLKGLQGAHITKSQKNEAIKDIGKFVLLDVIKDTKFSAVYLTEDHTSKKLRVIKKSIKSKAGFDEARMLEKFKHNNIVNILGTSKTENTFIVVMDHLAGGSLQERMMQSFKSQAFYPIAEQICAALESAHEHKVMHKNIRPSNILFDAEGVIKLTDFGFDEHYSNNGDDKKSWYKAPKYFGSELVCDIYSTGSLFYHMLTGEPLKLLSKKIDANNEFLKLLPIEQEFIKNMVEKDAPHRHISFNSVVENLNRVTNYKKRLPFIRLAKQLGIYTFIIVLLLLGAAWFYPEFLKQVILQINLFFK